jgi:hypothetical protein
VRFQAGHHKIGGRQRGTPNKASVALKDFARQFLESDEYRRKLRARILRGQAVKIEELLYYYAFGKPSEATEDSEGDGVSVSHEELKRAADETRALITRRLAERDREGSAGEPQ